MSVLYGILGLSYNVVTMKHAVPFCLFLGAFPLLPAASQDRQMPNVIFILADDIGYTDLGCYGATRIKTPAVDRLAAEGVRFTHAYAPASTSSPSRYALLTGEYAWRKNVGILPADAPLTIDPASTTLPGFLKKNGYLTGLVGKWHLGLGENGKLVDFNGDIQVGPLAVGFDYAYYFPATNDRVLCVYIENNHVVGLDSTDPIMVSYRRKVENDPTGKEHPELLRLKPHLGHDATIVNGISRIGWMGGGEKARWKDEEMAFVLLEKSKAFVQSHADEPFLLYYAPHNAHKPCVPSEIFRGKSAAGIYGDVIEEFDYCVGELVRTLKENNLYDNIFIVISSDNGPMIKEDYKDGALENINEHDHYGGLRGQKYSLYEAGTRMPFIFSWPERVEQPFVQTSCFTYFDMLSTFAGLLDLPITSEEANDSRDGSDLFLKKDVEAYREYIMIQNNGGEIAIRKDNWKFIPATQKREAELYDWDKDPSELHDLTNAFPEKVAQLQKYVEGIIRRMSINKLSRTI